MARRGLRDNNITTKRIMQDMIEEGRHEDAKRVRAQMEPYRSTGIVKKFKSTGKIKRYKNSGAFNAECGTSRQSPLASKAMVCELQSLRELANGEGMASIKVRPLFGDSKASRAGTWRLHFASYSVLKNHLRNRVTVVENGRPTMNAKALDGQKKRRR